MEIRCRCAACGAEFTVGEEFRGTKVGCIECGRQMLLPSATRPAPPVRRPAATPAAAPSLGELIGLEQSASRAAAAGTASPHTAAHKKKPRPPSSNILPVVVVACVALGILVLGGVIVGVLLSLPKKPDTVAASGPCYLVLNLPDGERERIDARIDDKRKDLPNTGEIKFELAPGQHHVSLTRDGQQMDYAFTLKAGDTVSYTPWQDTGKTRHTEVALRLQGTLHTVDVQLNGHTVEMIVDTGASSVSIPWKMAQEAKIDVTNARRVRVGGIGGGAWAYQLTVDSIKVGECDVHGVECFVMDRNAPPAPALLGQTFFSHVEWKITPSHRLILTWTPK